VHPGDAPLLYRLLTRARLCIDNQLKTFTANINDLNGWICFQKFAPICESSSWPEGQTKASKKA